MAIRGTALVPSAVTKTLVCVDQVEHFEFSGRLCNPYMKEVRAFHGVIDLLHIMESFFDDIAYPQAYYSTREFNKRKGVAPEADHPPDTAGGELPRYHDDALLQSVSGAVCTFTLQVLFRQNATWQGILTWNDKQQSHKFRSTLELLRLMEDALEQNLGEPLTVSWSDSVDEPQ